MSAAARVKPEQFFNADEWRVLSARSSWKGAALVLHATPPVRVNVSSATYYLLGHSAELMLKAFLFKHGQTISGLRKINHDLEKLASLAREIGLPEKVQLTQISSLASVYKDKSFEYRTRTKMMLPNLDLLIAEVKSLKSTVFDKLWK